MTLLFRFYQPSDFADLVEMALALYREDPGGTMSSRQVAATVAFAAKHPEQLRIFIFADQDQVVGYSLAISMWSSEFGGLTIHVDEMYVRPGFRGLAWGQRFLEELPFWWPEPVVALSLETTVDNVSAERFYRRAGFVPSGNRHWSKRLRSH